MGRLKYFIFIHNRLLEPANSKGGSIFRIATSFHIPFRELEDRDQSIEIIS